MPAGAARPLLLPNPFAALDHRSAVEYASVSRIDGSTSSECSYGTEEDVACAQAYSIERNMGTGVIKLSSQTTSYNCDTGSGYASGGAISGTFPAKGFAFTATESGSN